MTKRLIVNADDFGFNRDVNSGIIEAHERGILTATTLMANGVAFDHAVELARKPRRRDHVGCALDDRPRERNEKAGKPHLTADTSSAGARCAGPLSLSSPSRAAPSMEYK